MKWHIEIERPIRVRDYEQNWDFARSETSRFQVSSEQRWTFPSLEFGELISAIWPSGSGLLLECDELWHSTEKVESCLGLRCTEYSELPPIENLSSWQYNPGQRGVVYIQDGGPFCFYIDRLETLNLCLQSFNVLEWYGTFWRGPRACPMLFLNWLVDKCERDEECFLKHLLDYKSAFFLSPSHQHMEIVVQEPSEGQRIHDALLQFNEKDAQT